MTRGRRGALSLALGAVLLALLGCAVPEPGTEPAEWESTPADAVYPEPGEFVIGPDAAVVRFTALRPDVLVRASPEAPEWVYTPAEIEVLVPGSSGLDWNESFSLAIPGGVADGVEHAGTWVFDKAQIDPDSTYLVSWSELEHPGFELGHVLDYLYEVRDEGRTLVRLQDPPGVGWTEETFEVESLLETGEVPPVLGALSSAARG